MPNITIDIPQIIHDINAFPVGLNQPPAISENVDDPRNELQREWSPFTYPFNLTQQPMASVLIGFTKDSLPVGLQIVAAKYTAFDAIAANL